MLSHSVPILSVTRPPAAQAGQLMAPERRQGGTWMRQDGVPRQSTPPGSFPESGGEASLLSQAARGSETAFRQLAARYLPSLLAIGRRMLGEDAEAEDVAQEALVRLWRSAGQIEVGEAGARPWLNRVAANLCLDRLRSRRIAPVTVDELPEAPVAATQLQALEAAALAARVDRALQELPERQRLALVLFHYQGLSQEEAAEVLGVSQDALESLLARARRTLKAALAEEWKALLPDSGQDVPVGWKTRHGERD